MIDEKRSPWIPALGAVFLLIVGIIGYQVFIQSRGTANPPEASLPTISRTSTPTRTTQPTLTPIPTSTPVPTPTPIPNAVDDSAYAITYSDWIGVSDPAASGGGYRKGLVEPQSIGYRTSAPSTSVSLITYRGPDQGIAQIEIDGNRQPLLDLYSATPEYQVVQDYTGLPEITHNIVVRVRGAKNSASTGTEIRVDGFRIGNETIEDSQGDIRYRSWVGSADDSAYGGTYRSTEAKDSTASYSFTGTRVDWITLLCRRCGKTEVRIDQQMIRTVDLYGEKDEWRHVESFDNLAPGEHTISIRVLGEHNPSSTRDLVVIDAFSVP